MKVANIAINDWANFSQNNAIALRAAGVDCQAYVINPHKFQYPNAARVVSQEEMIQHINDADIVQIFFATEAVHDLIKKCNPNKAYIVYYASSGYRKNPEISNRLWNPIVEKSVVCHTEFYGQGAKNEVYLVGAIDTDGIHPNYKEDNEPLKIAHYPSNVAKKGTHRIVNMIDRLQYRGVQFEFRDREASLVPSEENRKRMSECDVYVEMFQLKLGGKWYGSWGVTALEAAALGKIVVTNHLTQDVYTEHYGETALQITNTYDEFENKIEELAAMSSSEIRLLQKATRKWVEEKHSPLKTGIRIKEKILEI